MSKTLIKRRCQSLLYGNIHESPLGCDDATFVMDLLEHHPEWEQRTGGRDNVEMVTTGLAIEGTTCFYISRQDRPRPLVRVSFITSLWAMTVPEARQFWAENHDCREGVEGGQEG